RFSLPLALLGGLLGGIAIGAQTFLFLQDNDDPVAVRNTLLIGLIGAGFIAVLLSMLMVARGGWLRGLALGLVGGVLAAPLLVIIGIEPTDRFDLAYAALTAVYSAPLGALVGGLAGLALSKLRLRAHDAQHADAIQPAEALRWSWRGPLAGLLFGALAA